MVKYDQFERKHHVRFIKDFLDPKTWNAEIISYPKETALFWYNPTKTIECPTSELGYFKNLHKPYVFTLDRYADIELLGNPKHINKSISSLISTCKKKSPKFKYIKDYKKKITVPTRNEIIFNFGVVNTFYNYISHPLTPYYMWYNTLASTVEAMKVKNTGATRHKYIIIQLPYNIPNLVDINKFIGEPRREMLDEFSDYTYFNLLEFFRFVDDEHKEYSIFAKLPPEDFQYIDIIFTINNKVVFVNLETLASITTAHKVTTNLKKYEGRIIKKLLIVFFNRILEYSPIVTEQEQPNITVSDLGNLSQLGIDITDDINGNEETSKNKKVNIDHVVENEIGDKKLVTHQIEKGDDLNDSEDDVIAELESSVDALETEDVVEDATALTPEEIEQEPPLTDNTKLIKAVEDLYKNKVITKTVYNNIVNGLKEQPNKPSPYKDGQKLKDLLTYTEDEIDLSQEDTTITDHPAVLDKTMNQDTLTVVNEKYRQKTYKKDIISTIYSMQRAGFIVQDHEVNKIKTVLGEEEEHIISIQTLTGEKSTIRIVLPVLQDDNTIVMSGNKYIIRKQRADIPIKKISNKIVSINSYYGKLFISKATFKKDDLGYWFYKQLLKKYEVDKDLKDIAALEALKPDANVPKHYGIVARYVKSFKYKEIVYLFDYEERKKLIKDIDLSKIEKEGVLVGKKGNKPVIMGFDNNVYVLDKDKVKLGTIFEILGFDINKGPMEYLNVKIYKEQIPLAVILSYYIGFHHLLKILNVKYEVIDSNKRIQLQPNQYKIKFKDKTYIVEKDYGVNDLVLGGFKSVDKYIKNINVKTLMSKHTFPALFTAMNLPILYVNEIKLMENMYIDPITKNILELYKYPTKFIGVLLKAAEILNDDNYKHPNSIDGAIIKGYERISGMMYLELVKALRLNINKSHFGKSKVEINPYAIRNKINEDSTTVLVDDLNPVANMKQFEDVTYLGSHGRKEETMSASTRVMHPSEIGIISEGTKDNGAVGISAYLTAAPKIKTTRGTVDKYKDTDGWTNILSTSAMLAPFAIKDDVKRLNFVNIQNAHVIPMNEMRAPYIRTGYEAILPIRAPEHYAITAKEDGVVESVSKTKITVKYKTLGKKSYPLREWTTKEESNTCYKHKLVPNLSKGQKFVKDDTIAYDQFFFEPDIFNPKRVIYKMGTSLNVALMESPDTYEDSGAISSKISKVMGTKVVKTKSIIVNATDTILNPLMIGDEVKPKTPLMSIADETLSKVGNLDQRALEALKGLKTLTPKSSYKGKITNIKVFYNCEFKELSPSLKKLAKLSDEKLLEETGVTGQVNSSYSIKGKPLLEGEVEIKYYIDIEEKMGTGDKAILANQLKFTVGNVYDVPIYAEDGSEVDMIFSTRSIEARIVNSPGLIGTTSKLLEVVTKQACDMYFK